MDDYKFKKLCCADDYLSYIKDRTEYKLNNLYNSYTKYTELVRKNGKNKAEYINVLRIALLKGYIHDQEEFKYDDQEKFKYSDKYKHEYFDDKAFELIQ